jgi:RHS repeat-associated protein
LTTSSGTASYTYPADSHRLTAVDGAARNHDAAGNTVSLDGKELVYNDANRMSQVKQGGAVVEAYTYNHRGERVLRAPTAGEAQITLYDEAGQWLGNYSATGSPLQQAIWLGDYPVALINAPASGVPELAYVQPDHLGTPRVVIDPVRDVAIWEWSSKSEVFGNQAPNGDPDGDGAVFELALRFPGQQATNASGMFYNYQRDYDSAVGRYSQSDPVGLIGGISTYSYALAHPTLKFDAKGLTTTVVVTVDNGFGTHAAVHITGNDGVLYDPAGGYPGASPGYSTRGSGDIFSGVDASLSAYISYQRGAGSEVRTYSFPTTSAQELMIQQNMEDEGGAMGGFCALKSASVLRGVGPFKDLGRYLFPKSLGNDISELPGVDSKIYPKIEKKNP